MTPTRAKELRFNKHLQNFALKVSPGCSPWHTYRPQTYRSLNCNVTRRPVWLIIATINALSRLFSELPSKDSGGRFQKPDMNTPKFSSVEEKHSGGSRQWRRRRALTKQTRPERKIALRVFTSRFTAALKRSMTRDKKTYLSAVDFRFRRTH